MRPHRKPLPDRDDVQQFFALHGKPLSRDQLRRVQRLQKRGSWLGLEYQDALQLLALQHRTLKARVTRHRQADGKAGMILDPNAPSFDPLTAIDALHFLGVGGRTTRTLRRYHRYALKMLAQEGREPTAEESAAYLRISAKQLGQLHRLLAPRVSLDQESGRGSDGDEGLPWVEVIPADHATGTWGWQMTESALERLEREEQLEILKSILTPAERAAVEGTARGVSKQAVSKARRRAIKKMLEEAERREWRLDRFPVRSNLRHEHRVSRHVVPLRLSYPPRHPRTHEWTQADKAAVLRLNYTVSPEDRIAMEAGHDRGLRPWTEVSPPERITGWPDLEHSPWRER
jgi:hypothetical protein